MQMLYNSDSFAVVRIEWPLDAGPAAGATRGGFEIVDKFARKEIFLEGPLAERFRDGVQALVERGPTQEEFEDFIAGFTGLALQPMTVH